MMTATVVQDHVIDATVIGIGTDGIVTVSHDKTVDPDLDHVTDLGVKDPDHVTDLGVTTLRNETMTASVDVRLIRRQAIRKSRQHQKKRNRRPGERNHQSIGILLHQATRMWNHRNTNSC